MPPYGIVKAIRTSSPPRRVSIGAVAVAADEPSPSPLTLDVLFACLPSCMFLLGIKIGYCAKLQTSYNSPFRSYNATGLRTSDRASSRWLVFPKSPQMLSPCRSFLHSSGVSGLSSIGLLGLFTSSIPYPRLSARFQKLMRCRRSMPGIASLPSINKNTDALHVRKESVSLYTSNLSYTIFFLILACFI